MRCPIFRDMTAGKDGKAWAAFLMYGTEPLARNGRMCSSLIA
jgi:hypothetical protein